MDEHYTAWFIRNKEINEKVGKYLWLNKFGIIIIFITIFGAMYLIPLTNLKIIHQQILYFSSIIISVILTLYFAVKFEPKQPNKNIGVLIYQIIDNIKEDEKNKTIKKIRILDKLISNIYVKYPLEDIFKIERQKEKRFFSELKEFPQRLMYLLNENNIELEKIESIKKIAKGIFEDSETLNEDMRIFSKNNEFRSKIYSKKTNLTMNSFRENRFVKIAFWTIIYIIIGIILYKNGFDKNNILTSVASLIGITAYIIFKK